MINLKENGFVPDIIIGHSWGGSLFVIEVFPSSPYIAYVEWYYNYENSDFDFANKDININDKAKLICKNSHILLDIVRSDAIITPTQWQKQQIPEIFADKVNVIHEGIDTNLCRPNPKAEFKVPDSVHKILKDDR